MISMTDDAILLSNEMKNKRVMEEVTDVGVVLVGLNASTYVEG
jgi:hypothetical protein